MASDDQRDYFLESFVEAHPSSTIIVCGCGESLRSFSQHNQFITIGVNDVSRLFTPNYLVVVNPPHQFKMGRFHYVKHSRAQYIFSHLNLPVPRSRLVKFKLGTKQGIDFSSHETLNYTQNSPYVAVCLAKLMGAATIGLIGVDFTQHHFFSKTGRHRLMDKLPQINSEFYALYVALKQAGVELINLSEHSQLKSIPFYSLPTFVDNYLSDNQKQQNRYNHSVYSSR